MLKSQKKMEVGKECLVESETNTTTEVESCQEEEEPSGKNENVSGMFDILSRRAKEVSVKEDDGKSKERWDLFSKVCSAAAEQVKDNKDSNELTVNHFFVGKNEDGTKLDAEWSKYMEKTVKKEMKDLGDDENTGYHRIRQCGGCGETTFKKMKVCARCKKIHYCSKKCQRKHWKFGHKEICKKSV